MGVRETEILRKGTEVEVSLEEEGFRGSWYAATVLRSVSKKNKIFVEFHNLMASDKAKKPLRQFVDSIIVRPKPPRELVRSFSLDEDVDAYHNEGWWEGIVTEVLDGSKYSVFFRSSREQLVFQESLLRLHREWVRGDWVPPLEDGASQSQSQS